MKGYSIWKAILYGRLFHMKGYSIWKAISYQRLFHMESKPGISFHLGAIWSVMTF